MSIVKKANSLYKNGSYKAALDLYEDLSGKNKFWSDILQSNIISCRRRISNADEQKNRFRGKSGLAIEGEAHKNILREKIYPGANILFISHEASLTGAPMVLVKVINWLRENFNISPFIVYSGAHTERVDEFKSLGKCLYIKELDECAKLDLQNFLEGISIDLVYANTVASGKLLQLAHSILGKNAKYLAHIHEKQGVVDHFLADAKYICSICEKIITVSEDMVSFLGSMAPHWVDISYFPPFIDLHSLDLIEGQVNAIPVIYGCGTIEPRKGFDLFCEAIHKLRNNCSFEFKAVWIGPSSREDEPKHSIDKYEVADVVEFFGPHPNPRELYRKGDIFFLSSREEPFSLASIEAAEQGLALLSFDGRCAPGMDAFIRQNECGLIAEALNTDDAAHCLQILLACSDMRMNMGCNGRAAVVAGYTAKSIMPNVLEFINNSKHVVSLINLKKIIVISLGPVPVFGLNTMEGGGLRCWGIARGIAESCLDVEVTLSFPRWYLDNEDPGAFDGVNILTWSDEEDLVRQIADMDIVIISYCFGGVSRRVANSLRPEQKLVLDCYVPIHPEVCARNSSDLIGEYVNYDFDRSVWSEVLVKGDYLLCANDAQKNYYFGMLFGLSKIDPINYDFSDNILIAPFGIDDHPLPVRKASPITDIVADGSFKLLWFGGVYPWFDVEGLIEAVGKIREGGIKVELIIVGAKNPFNQHPDFIATSNKILNIAVNDKYSNYIHVVDWVPYGDRFDWYRDADLVVTFNRVGIENRFSWRTRVLDFLSCEALFVTNGGDPVSEVLIDACLGFKIRSASINELADDLKEVIINVTINKVGKIDRNKLDVIKKSLTWNSIGKSIIDRIKKDVNDRS